METDNFELELMLEFWWSKLQGTTNYLKLYVIQQLTFAIKVSMYEVQTDKMSTLSDRQFFHI
jgi:hypothetical protein